jgi:hypothetical protein
VKEVTAGYPAEDLAIVQHKVVQQAEIIDSLRGLFAVKQATQLEAAIIELKETAQIQNDHKTNFLTTGWSSRCDFLRPGKIFNGKAH